MPRIPTVSLTPNVQGPVGQRQASGDDFTPGASAGLASARAALGAKRDAADAEYRAGSLAARATQQLGAGVRDVGEGMYQREVNAQLSAENANMAELRATWSEELATRRQAAKPGDRNFTQSFLDDFKKASDKAGEGATTNEAKRYVKSTLAGMRGDFLTTASKHQRDLVEVEARQNVDRTVNALSNATFADHSNLEHNLTQWRESATNYQAAGLSAEDVEKIHEAGRGVIVNSAIQGSLQADPAGTAAALKAGSWGQYLDGAKRGAYIEAAEREVKERESDRRIERAEAREAKREAQEQSFNKAAVAWADGKLRWRGGDESQGFVNLSSLDVGASQIIHMKNLMKVQENEHLELKGDPGVFKKLWAAKIAGTLTTAQIDDSLGAGITKDDWSFLTAHRVDKHKNDAVLLRATYDRVEKEFAGGGIAGISDPVASAKAYQSWLTWFQPQYDELRESGKSAAELLGQDSPLMTAIPKFRPSVAEQARTRFGTWTPPPPLKVDAEGRPYAPEPGVAGLSTAPLGSEIGEPEFSEPALGHWDGAAAPKRPRSITSDIPDMGGLRVQYKPSSVARPLAPPMVKAGLVPQIRPGESVAAFLKRSRGGQ